ncbi:hypothetical protein EYF80_025710 [Liparis tanakae]|uniref:Uncharacterized protein n=1 Tax=Liparis tanakae TaxID=230148 RepID=A0A4Z2HGW7_9TELE|nr:hypothetical protein EYF80_025710 [Liparis tanakae]
MGLTSPEQTTAISLNTVTRVKSHEEERRLHGCVSRQPITSRRAFSRTRLKAVLQVFDPADEPSAPGGRLGPQATNLFLVLEPLFVAVSACDWYPMITFCGTPNLSLYTLLKKKKI